MSTETGSRPVGRPPVPDEKRRGSIVNFRATSAEAEAVKRAAAERGISVTEYLRGLVAADNAAGTENG